MTAPLPDEKHFDTIVLGAGISGLTAAQILQREGQKVVVLEARERIGGRIHTVLLDPVPSNDWPAVTVDLGANYLHGCTRFKGQQPLFFLAQALGITTAVCASDCDGRRFRGWDDPEMAAWRDHTTGQPIPIAEVAEVSHLCDKVLRRAVEMVTEDPVMLELSLKRVLDLALEGLLSVFFKAGARSCMTLTPRERGIYDSLMCRFFYFVNPGARLSADSLRALGYDEDDIKAEHHFNPEYPPPAERRAYLNALHRKMALAAGPQVQCASKVGGKIEDRLVVSGFSDFVHFLARGLDIRLGSPVRRVHVERHSSGFKGAVVTVHGGRRFRAANCVVSLPIGVLKGLDERSRVIFSPSLPEAKMAAIRRLGIPQRGAPTHNKVVLRFPRVFWEPDAPHLQCPDARLHLLNLHLYGKPGVLLAHVWGGSGFRLSERTDAEAVELVLALLRGMYGAAAVPLPVQALVTRWSEDPFSLGAYTDDEHGSWERDRATYAAPLPSKDNPVLVFVGEATREDHSKECTHGAFLSGFEGAKLVLSSAGVNFGLNNNRLVDYLLGQCEPDRREEKKKKKKRSGQNRAGMAKKVAVSFSTSTDAS